jgi:hypothetical protein
MMDVGFMTKYKITIKVPKNPPPGVPKRDIYLIRAYEYPEEWDDYPQAALYEKLLEIRLQLRAMGEEKHDMIVFSFWPDVIMLKEIGDPLQVAHYLKLDRKELHARVIMAQGRQNTNYAINLYACHPFFIQGYASMTNGECTAFTPIREFLLSRNFPGYSGYQSDSEVFTHILHYTQTRLGLDISAYKHIITPLQDADDRDHHQCRPVETAQTVVPPPDHRRAQLRHRLPAGPQSLHGSGPQEVAARRGGRPARAICLLF